MADIVTEAGVVPDPTQLDVKLFNRWSFDDIQALNPYFDLFLILVIS